MAAAFDVRECKIGDVLLYSARRKKQTVKLVGEEPYTAKTTGKTMTVFRWESECIKCGERYTFTSGRSEMNPIRTCAEHRMRPGRPIPAVQP